MRPARAVTSWLCVTLLSLGATAHASAQTLPSSDDKTGTNPLNIQSAVAASNEFQSLPDALFWNYSRYRYVMPLARRTMSAGIDIPIVTSNVTGRTEVAFGDLGAQWKWIPWIEKSKGIVVGVDTTWSTSTNEALGAGRHVVTPFVQMVFLPSGSVVAGVSYAQRESIGGDADRLDVSQGIASLYLAWLPARTTWLIAEPQILMDYESDDTSGRVDLEWGRLLFGGVGTYIRPGIGLGSTRARPFDWKVEVGFRIIP
jgi:hypothetical protein